MSRARECLRRCPADVRTKYQVCATICEHSLAEFVHSKSQQSGLKDFFHLTLLAHTSISDTTDCLCSRVTDPRGKLIKSINKFTPTEFAQLSLQFHQLVDSLLL